VIKFVTVLATSAIGACVFLAACSVPASSTGYTCSEIQQSSDKATEADEYFTSRLLEDLNEDPDYFKSGSLKGFADQVCSTAKPEDNVDELLEADVARRVQSDVPVSAWEVLDNARSK
jgi:hypothetical protein